jgi:hypothetical protein
MIQPPIVPDTLICSACREQKPRDAFARSTGNTARGGRQYHCRACQSSYFATWRGRIAPPRPVEPEPTPRPLTFRCAACQGVHPLESATGPKRCTKGAG